MSSWIDTSSDAGFTLDVLPYGIFSTSTLDPRIGVAIGNYILDLKQLSREGTFSAIHFDDVTLRSQTLNAYAAQSPDEHQLVRKHLRRMLSYDTDIGKELRDHPKRGQMLIKMDDATMHMPMSIGDYTDFCVGQYHALNCADIFRPGTGLPANFQRLPEGYAGRASSIVVSGTQIRRPKGQYLVDGVVTFGPSRKIDFEVELAAFIGRGNEMGEPIDVDKADEHIFGIVLMNDWSARDIQGWESTPLGPFNGKNFGTSISPWIVPLDALESCRTKPLAVKSSFFPYLQQKTENCVFDIPIKVSFEDEQGKQEMFSCNTKNTVFSFAQMLAHHTIGGCPMRTGDLIATGTVSGPTRGELGSLLEASKNGTTPYEIEATTKTGQKVVRCFVEDGDTIEFKAPGFGRCSGKLVSN